MSALGLNDHHQSTVLNYMRFARYQRGQRLRAVDACFEDLKDSRLVEDTFTCDEVTEMLEGLLSVVRGEVESELINTAHTNVLLLRQVFQQAEKWHLKLQADISELENSEWLEKMKEMEEKQLPVKTVHRELLEQINDFEESEFAGAKRGDDFKIPASRLQPLNESGGSALLNMEIQRLNEENEMLRERMKSIESKAVGVSQEKSSLREDLQRTREELDRARSRKANYDPAEVEALQGQMANLKAANEQNSASNKVHAAEMEGDLTNTKHELLKIKDMLDMAEKELEKKVSQTAPFKNLKQMLQKKNEQLKDMRRQLSKYEETDD